MWVLILAHKRSTKTNGAGHYLSWCHLSLFALFVHRTEKNRLSLHTHTHMQIALPPNRLHCGRKEWWHIFFLCSARMHFMMMGSNPPSLETLKNQPSADLHTKSSLSAACMPFAVIRPWRSLHCSSHHQLLWVSQWHTKNTMFSLKFSLVSKILPCV